MAFGDRLKTREERREANAAALPGILGQPCTPSWSFQDPGAGFDATRAWWHQAFKSPIVALGNLKAPTGTRTFRIICDGSTAVVHPDDAGWLVRAVEPFMTRIKPIWAQAASYRTLASGVSVKAGLFPWFPPQWVCPECYPKIDQSASCNDQCTTTRMFGGSDTNLKTIYGYDNRMMRPWASNILLQPECGSPGPGGPDSLCMPVEGACKLLASATDYVRAFWQDVAQAVTLYNANPPPRPKDPPKPTAEPTAIAATPKRDVNWLPLLAVGLGTGLLGVFFWNTRR